MGFLAVVDELGIRQRKLREGEAALGIEASPDGDQPIALRERQGFQQHAVDDAEDRDVCANPDGHGQHHEEREAGLTAKEPQRVLSILQQSEHDSSSPRLVAATARHAHDGAVERAAASFSERRNGQADERTTQ